MDGQHTSRIVRFGPFECDLTTGDLSRQGRSIKLQDQPRQVLIALLEEPGRVVTREALQRRLWSDDTFVDFDNALNVAMRKIREALGDVAPVAHYVETVRGQGYRFIAPVSARLEPAGSATVRVDPAVAAPAPAVALGRRSMWTGLVLAAAAVGFTALGVAIQPLIGTPVDDAAGPLTAFALELDANERVNGHPAISPDGRLVVYQSSHEDDAVGRLRLRSLDTTDARTLPGTERGSEPFFSPDGQHLAFFADGKLKRMPVAGGLPHDVCAAATPRGGSWGEDGFIVFADGLDAGLFRVPASGGTAQPFTTLAADEANHRYPHVLPGAQSTLFTAVAKDSAFRIAVQRSGATGHEVIVPDGQNAKFGAGRLVYASASGEVFSAPFDPAGSKITGPPAAHRERARAQVVGHFALSVARNGTMVYLPYQPFPRRLAIVDRHGSIRPILEAPVREYDTPRLSPDGSQILVSIRVGILEQDVWVYDLRGRTLRRLTTNGNSRRALWTPDGHALTFDKRYGGGDNAFLMSASARSDEGATQITHAPVYGGAAGWVGNDLLYGQKDAKTPGDIWIVTRGVRDTARPLSVGERIQWGRPSPDGRWLAIVSNETGVYEVYLTTLPTPGPRTRISSGGGTEPVWAPSGEELFFRQNDEIVGVRVSKTGPLPGPRRSTRIKGLAAASDANLSKYDVFADGSFLILLDERPPTAPKPTVMLNWALALDK
jgi:serine/threonine-protein kinase